MVLKFSVTQVMIGHLDLVQSCALMQRLGYDRLHPKVLIGNLLCFRCLLLLIAADTYGCVGLGEQPRLSKMRWLPTWRHLMDRGYEEVWTASCAYGAPWRKEFMFLGKRLPLAKVHKRCPGFHSHIRVAGNITKGTSEYTPLLAAALAAVVAEGVNEVSSRERDVSLDVDGPERAAINELLLSSQWT